MRRVIGFLAVAFTAFQFGLPLSSWAQSGGTALGGQGHLVIPASNNHTAADVGVRSHTNLVVFVPEKGNTPAEAPPYSGYGFDTPASLGCIYGLVTATGGCNPNLTTTNPSGGSQSIAIVDAYDDPTADYDLGTFSSQFGLPTANLEVVYESGSAPAADPTGGWELEESLDLQMAHAMAPNAKLYLVEANSNSDNDLYYSVEIATNLVTCGEKNCPRGGHGKGEVSMGWGSSEYSTERHSDSLFNNSNVVYFAAAGDEPGTEYPCVSPNVVCVGGTSVARNLSTGALLYQVAWMDAAGGPSEYEPRPTYQSGLKSVVGGYRGVPDISFTANAYNGVWIYDSTEYEVGPGDYEEGGWFIAGGTSVGSPSLAGIVNAAGKFYENTQEELDVIYAGASTGAHDVTMGYCGPYTAFAATAKWDFCTGVGTPWGYSEK